MDISEHISKSKIRESHNLDDHGRIVLKVEEIDADRNDKTLDDEFFSNISFDDIDELCVAANNRQVVKPESNSNNMKDETILVNIEGKEKKLPDRVTTEILDRVKEIRKNSKPFRRYTDINQTAIPNEVFYKGVIDLECASFSREKKVSSKIDKSMPFMTSSKLCALDEVVKDKSNGKSHTSGNVSNIPVKAACDKPINKNYQTSNNQYTVPSNFSAKNNKIIGNIVFDGAPKNTIKREYSESSGSKSKQVNKDSNNGLTKSCNDQLDNNSRQSTGEFVTAGCGKVPVNQDQLLRYEAKVYQDIEKEVCDENGIVTLKQTKEKPKSLRPNLEKQASKGLNSTAETLKLHVDVKSKKLVLPDCSQEQANTESDDFSTAKGREIHISKEKESFYMQIYKEFSDDPDLCSAKKPSHSISNAKPRLQHNASHGKAPATSTATLSINQSTAQSVTISKNQNNPNAFKSASGKFTRPSTYENVSSTISRPDYNGFTTVRGVTVATSDEIEKKFREIYDGFNETDEASLLDAKNNRASKNLASRKLEDRVKLVFNKKARAETRVKALKIPSAKPSNDGFSTAKVIDNAVSGEKESYYSRVHNELSDDVDMESLVKNSKDKPGEAPNETSKDAMPEQKEEKAIVEVEDISQFASFFFTQPQQFGRENNFDEHETVEAGTSTEDGSTKNFHEEKYVNQPLDPSSAANDCIDELIDSLPNELDLLDFNDGKLVVADNLKADVSADHVDSQEQVVEELMLLCLRLQRLHKEQQKSDERVTALTLKPGESFTTTFTNNTSSERQLLFRCEENVVLKRDKQNFEMLQATRKNSERKRVESQIPANKRGKRGHADNDSVTPQSAAKKPRLASGSVCRKLFLDHDGNEELKPDDRLENVDILAVQSMEIEELSVLAAGDAVDLSVKRSSAILLQEQIIRNKSGKKIKQIEGTLLRERLANKGNRQSWRNLVGTAMPEPLGMEQLKQHDPHAKVLEVTASNAKDYSFSSSSVTGKRNVVSFDVGEGATLIFQENGQAGVAEFSQAFLAMPGVDPKLLPAGWIENHYKWIVWKLAAMDRTRFGSVEFVRSLTPQRVMEQLKYRYDREIDKAQRPALRRILEKDDAPSRRIVLCISKIEKRAEATGDQAKPLPARPRWKIQATDGWYDVPLTIDAAMDDYISTGKIKEGTKIITCCAQLLDCESGFFPLEKPPNVSLKIHSNCTRRARWDTKLGYQKNSRPFAVKLKDIVAVGGTIGQITAAAARVYQIMYREMTADGKSIYRNEKCEGRAALVYQRDVERKMQALYAEAINKNDYYKDIIECDEDSECSSHSMQKYNNYERKQEECMRQLQLEVRRGMPPPRKVTTLRKVRLFDDSASVVLSIWGAGDDSEFNIKEGDTVRVYNSLFSGHWGGEQNLTANGFTHFETVPALKLIYPERVCTLIPDIGDTFQPNFREFDTVGVVVSSVSDAQGKKNLDAINIAYPKSEGSGSAYLSVRFPKGLAEYGYKDIFSSGTLVACSNLNWRAKAPTIAEADCSEKTVLTVRPRQAHLLKELSTLKAIVQDPQRYAKQCAEQVDTELAKIAER